MKKIIFGVLILTAMATVSLSAQTADEKAVSAVVASYEKALSGGDAVGLVALYTPDGVLMPNENPTVVGAEGLKGFYGYTFSSGYKIGATITIDEAKAFGSIAYVRSHSKEHVVDPQGKISDFEAREIFVLSKTGNKWLISRYIYNSKPADQK